MFCLLFLSFIFLQLGQLFSVPMWKFHAQTWNVHFRCLKFRALSQHAVCTECLRHKLLLRDLGPHLSARSAQQKLYASHLKSQYADRQIYWQRRGQARSHSCITVILDSMDQSKFFYPQSANREFLVKELGGMQRPKAHITSAIFHGFFVLYTVSPADLRKDSSTMAEIFMYGLHLLKTEFQVDLAQLHVWLQTDNTTRECKNNVIARLLGGLTSNGNSTHS